MKAVEEEAPRVIESVSHLLSLVGTLKGDLLACAPSMNAFHEQIHSVGKQILSCAVEDIKGIGGLVAGIISG